MGNMFNNFGVQELLIILGILIFLFGASKIPALARGLGKSVGEFKKGMKEEGKETQPKEEDLKRPETVQR